MSSAEFEPTNSAGFRHSTESMRRLVLVSYTYCTLWLPVGASSVQCPTTVDAVSGIVLLF